MAVETIHGACGHTYERTLKGRSKKEKDRSRKYWEARECLLCYQEKMRAETRALEEALSLPALNGVSERQVSFARSVRADKIKGLLAEYAVELTIDTLGEAIRSGEPHTGVFYERGADFWLDNKRKSLETLMRRVKTPARKTNGTS